MKRVAVAIMCAPLLALVLAPVVASADAKPGIAVLEFQNKADNQYWWPGGGEAIQDAFVTELAKSGRFSVIGRQRMNAVVSEEGLPLTGDVDPSTAMRIGKLLGVAYLLTGAVTEYGKSSTGGHAPGIRRLPGFQSGKSVFVAAANARLFNISTGEIVWADEARNKVSMDVLVGGSGGEAGNDHLEFDKVMKPAILDLAASLKAADL